MPDLNFTGPTCTRVVMVGSCQSGLYLEPRILGEPPYICKGLSTASSSLYPYRRNGNILVGVESGRKYFLVEYTAEGIELWRRH